MNNTWRDELGMPVGRAGKDKWRARRSGNARLQEDGQHSRRAFVVKDAEMNGTVRYLGVELEDALAIKVAIEI
ncbi:hypothetical protein [Ruegeria sp. HKCCA5426]|uniref:hypothetical protein n=1 Tax=Ruegeria sp. HKCCA5426 TaxID=2682985 RepID=UPI00148956BF|nr:hypothetical protein [Ruegeria sp. HKCCA5426]